MKLRTTVGASTDEEEVLKDLGRNADLCIFNQEAIAQLRDAGHSGDEISAALGVPKSTVNRIIREGTDRGAVDKRKGSG